MGEKLKEAEEEIEELRRENQRLLTYIENLEKQVEALSERYAMANNILLNTRDLVIQVDNDLTITFVNESAVKALGFKNANEILGKLRAEDLWVEDGKEKEFLEECIKRGRSVETLKMTVKNRRGEEKIFLVNAGPILNVLGEIKGAYAIYTDITEEEATREELQKTNEELRVANEELQAANEELQQTTEELRTSNEELKVTTEELNRMKEELEERVRIRTAELERSRDELQRKVEELEKFTELAIGRELKMVELKEENARLSKEIIRLKKELLEKRG